MSTGSWYTMRFSDHFHATEPSVRWDRGPRSERRVPTRTRTPKGVVGRGQLPPCIPSQMETTRPPNHCCGVHNHGEANNRSNRPEKKKLKGLTKNQQHQKQASLSTITVNHHHQWISPLWMLNYLAASVPIEGCTYWWQNQGWHFRRGFKEEALGHFPQGLLPCESAKHGQKKIDRFPVDSKRQPCKRISTQ